MPRLFPPFVGGSGAVGLLVLRLVAGSAMMLHGWPKIQHAFSWMGPQAPVPGAAQALAPGVARELCGFAEGLKQDEAAVKAAWSLPWSNGQVEGQINSSRLIKRQMLGRAGFDLLRRRFLQAG
jgi:hypothetical protein